MNRENEGDEILLRPEECELQWLANPSSQILTPARQTFDIVIPHSAQSIVTQSGFDVEKLTQSLAGLSNTLSIVVPPEPRGFSLELAPGGVAHLDISTDSVNPFKVELMGDADGYGEARISRVGRHTIRDEWLKLPDIQEFVRSTYPKRQATFRMDPVKDLLQGPVTLRTFSVRPTNLYAEAKSPDWRNEARKATHEQVNRFLEGLLPSIEIGFLDVEEDQLQRLTDNVEAAEINVTFYSKWNQNRRKRKVARRESMIGLVPPQLYNGFDIMLDKQPDPFMRFETFHDTEGLHCIFLKMDFRGQAEEVESTVDAFNRLFQTTPAYQKATQLRLALEEGKQ